MLQLGQDHIRLKANATSKADAIRLAGNVLVESGNIKPQYINSMMEREQVANTYLGNGIAIPHGLPKDRDFILQTGISVTQVPDGVAWNPGETVYLVVGIAAKSDEHIEILTNLTHVLDDEAMVQRLAKTDNPQEIVACLTQARQQPAGSPQATEADFDQSVEVSIQNPTGLHARPATAFVSLAKEFESEIRVRHGQQTANGKSLVSLLKLGVENGSTIRIMAQGPDAGEALQALKAAVEAGLEEEEAAAPSQGVALPALEFSTEALPGIPASPGLAIAPLHQFRRGKIVFSATAKDPQAEADHLKRAIATAKVQLQELYEEVKQRSGAGKASIFQAHKEFLDDPEMLEEALTQLGSNRSAGWAWQQTFEERARGLETLSDPLLAGRATDLRDVGRRVLRLLADKVEEEAALPDHPVILLAEDLTPSDTARLDPALILGFCTAGGGPTSHTAIIARSLDIPAMVGAGPAVLNLPDGETAILDGDRGNLYVNPTEADLEKARQAQQDLRAQRDVEHQSRYEPALTTDGQRVEVVANIGAAAEAEQAVDAGAEGIGLLRTEFLFLGRSDPPSEEEQFAALSRMTQALNGLPLIVRTLDIGGDKPIPYLDLPAEENPFLGVRGIRLCLARTDLFETQLRAIFRAAATGPVKIMFPMIATLEDLRSAKTIVESVRSTLNAAPVEIGMMVEVPSVVMMVEEFAQEVDFFSVGTNDLTQYLLAMDRGHPILAKQADGLHPAVLRAIDRIVQAAKAAGKWVGVCGGIAGDPKGAAILAGLGVTELSVSIPSVAAVKARIRSLSSAQIRKLAQRALTCRSAEEVRSL